MKSCGTIYSGVEQKKEYYKMDKQVVFTAREIRIIRRLIKNEYHFTNKDFKNRYRQELRVLKEKFDTLKEGN